jgi:hypothetical protein
MNQKEDKPVPLALERHYSVSEIAALWAVSDVTVRRLFENEPGVLSWGKEERVGWHRRYRSMRIPESIMIRVHERLRNPVVWALSNREARARTGRFSRLR